MVRSVQVSVAMVLGSFFSAFPTYALAQSTAGISREEIERQPVTPLPPSTGQAVTVSSDVERAPCPLADPSFAGVTLTLQRAEFSGLGGLSEDMLRPTYARYVGQNIPIATVCDIRDSAATLLRRKGYLAAVQVPPQKISDGVVKFDVLLGRVVDFQVRGNAGKAEGLISGYLSSIKEQPVFNILEAERYLLLARDIPGYDVRLTLRPAGTVPGEVIGEVLVDYRPVEAEANVQNYGSKSTGRFGGLLQARYNGLFGIGDRTSIGFFNTADFKEQHVLQLGEQIRLGREGLTLSADFVHAWTRPDLGPAIDLRSRTMVGSIEARYPLVRRQAKNIYLAGGLDLINQRVSLASTPFTRDKLRVGYIRADVDSIDANSLSSVAGFSAAEPRWRMGGSLELRHGLGIFNATKGCGPNQVRCATAVVLPSQQEADPTAFVARATATFEYRPAPALAIVTSVRAQYAPNPLLSYEEFSAGNFTSGRGYDPGILTGDSGIGVNSEFRFGSLVPKSAKSSAFQGYAFVDSARVWNKDRLVRPLGLQRLVSVGGGIRAAYGDRAILDVGAAVPLRRVGTQTKRSDVRLLVNLFVKLAPNGRR
jgi:hemolysin activation/secretion protein